MLDHATRVKASVVILVLASLASVVMSLSRAHVSAPVTLSRTELFGRRLSALREALPQQGVVGYLTDPDTALWRLRRTRYFLAPLLVDHSTRHDLVVGDFDADSIDGSWLAARGLVLVRDFGQGVMLLKRSSK